MNNLLITYSTILDEGFENYIYILSNQIIDIRDIEKQETCAVLIPYDYKNQIEPKCFHSTHIHSSPKIFPINQKIPFTNIQKAKSFLIQNTNTQNTNATSYLNNNHSIEFEKIEYKEYEKNFLRIQSYLKKGDIYEINYCIPFVFTNIELNPLELFFHLADSMKAPFTAFFKINNEYILSFSPERFLKKVGNTLYTEPIKGTSPRSDNPEEDEKNKQYLKNNLKEKTENAMIVDVARNDLSKIAQRGTVKVEELFSIKTYATVHQMVSKISCKIKPGITFKDIIHATFPMASMTGAPKIRAMQIAEETEKFPRDYYSGTLGIYNNGNFDLSVLIRSIFYNAEKKQLKIWAGSAITIYAHPENEYKECLLKAEKIIQTLKIWHLSPKL